MDRVAGTLAATDKSQESWELSESESWSNHEKEVTVKPGCVQKFWNFREF